jgi:hypothetical protein
MSVFCGFRQTRFMPEFPRLHSGGQHDLWRAHNRPQQERRSRPSLFRDVLGFKSVDAGHGWLIFALPPGEVAFHPSGKNGPHELYFLCEDLKSEMATLANKGVTCSAVHEERWGSITKIGFPGGGEIGLYQPKHPTALDLGSK